MVLLSARLGPSRQRLRDAGQTLLGALGAYELPPPGREAAKRAEGRAIDWLPTNSSFLWTPYTSCFYRKSFTSLTQYAAADD
jgi:hypothetical protein